MFVRNIRATVPENSAIRIDARFEIQLAAFRHRIIAEALEAVAGEITSAVKEAASREYFAPGGRLYKPDERSIS